MRKHLPAITVGLITGLGWMAAMAHQAKPIKWDFDKDAVGKAPEGWKIAFPNPVEGKSAWTVAADPSAPSAPNVLSLTLPTGGDDNVFNLAMVEKIAMKDLNLTVKLKANGGKADQGGGLVWRCKDEKNYYVARINPLEGNYRVYKVVDGKRTQLQSADVKTEAGKWYTMRVEVMDKKISCYLSRKKVLEVDDDTLNEAGMVGVWTKSDAATSFDNLVAGSMDPHD